MPLSRLLILASAAVLVLAGMFVSASTMMEVLVGGATPPGESLHRGAILFKFALIVLGLSIAVLSTLRLDAVRRFVIDMT